MPARIRAKRALGDATVLEELQAEADVSSQRVAVLNSRQSLDGAEMNLRRLLGQGDAAAVGEGPRAFLSGEGGLDLESADRMSENVLTTFGLPFSVATNFLINGRDYLVPMSVEEPSVVAAASNAARMVRGSGGFFTDSDPSLMTAQVQMDDVPDVEGAARVLREHRMRLFSAGDRSIPRMIERGGGCRDLEVRVLSVEHGVLVVDLFVAVGDAMGANTVDTVAEAVAPVVQSLVGGTIGLRILSNLPLRRLVRPRCEVARHAPGGPAGRAGEPQAPPVRQPRRRPAGPRP